MTLLSGDVNGKEIPGMYETAIVIQSQTAGRTLDWCQ